MANLTYVPRRAVEEGAFAFDTGPGMALVDGLARKATREADSMRTDGWPDVVR
jgi:1,6-anhydro-N-acetylmuramate kinase